ncbi:MAG: hypothetical protein ACFFA8_05405 [Promethearchaeota archaeon]
MVMVSLFIELIERQHWEPLSTFLHIVALIGVFIHELSHYVMCLMVRVKAKGFMVKYRSEITGKVAPHGSVTLPEFEKISVMQAFMVSIAPLLISTFLFLLCLDILFMVGVNLVESIIISIIALSLLIGSRPSGPDIMRIFNAYEQNPRYSLYQIGLVVLSMMIVFFFVDFSMFIVPFEFIIYIIFFFFVIGGYFMLKYTFQLIMSIFRSFRNSPFSQRKIHLRRRHKPVNPNKSGIEEPQW